MRLSLLLVLFSIFLLSTLHGQNNGFQYTINQDSFPKIVVDFNLRNPVIKLEKDFLLTENNENVDFSFVEKEIKLDTSANKNILILVENLKQNERLDFYKKVLLNALPFIIEKGDKFNIAVFDRVRKNGDQTIFLLLDEYTDDREKLKDAINEFRPKNDIFSKNKSSHIYHAIYEGLQNLNKRFKNKRYLFILSSAYNNKYSIENLLESSKQFAIEHDIPIYSVQYLIPNGEAHKLTNLVESTYGDEILTKESNGAAVTLTTFMDEAYKKSLGQNYSIAYTSTFPNDGKEYKSILSIEGKKYEIEVQTPKQPWWHILWNKYRYYTIGGILLLLFLLGLLIRSLSLAKQRDRAEKAELASAIDTAQGERNKATALIANQNKELQQIKREKQKKEEQERKKKMDKQFLQEMKTVGILPVIDYSVGGKNRKFKMEKPMIKIGRGDDNDIIVKNGTVSRNHAEIYFSGGEYFIRDIDSTAGTKVNGKKIKGVMVNHNDIIQLGEVNITFIR